ncbi:MAG TPA: VOC family protein, partial [Gaiellaceae bacterium]|nr:VOC family protein [Gaiellaceae bacterium]
CQSRRVFDHVTIRVSDPTAAERFYRVILAELEAGEPTGNGFTEWNDFSLVGAGDRPPTRRLHVGFSAPSREHVDAFWRAGTAAGARSDGAPGLRPQYRADYYGAFLLDPDGNSVEAVAHGDARRDGIVDHLWLRVRDPAASAAFYRAIAPHAGLEVERLEDRTIVRGAQGSFSLLHGEPTENVHIAFGGSSNESVEAFWAAATTAGYRDNGAPGERPHYHQGYYGAFVLDPDGHNVEVVCHNR